MTVAHPHSQHLVFLPRALAGTLCSAAGAAQRAPREAVGSVLTFFNCVGFAISIVSVQLLVWLTRTLPLSVAPPWLALGPALGLLMLSPLPGPRARPLEAG